MFHAWRPERKPELGYGARLYYAYVPSREVGDPDVRVSWTHLLNDAESFRDATSAGIPRVLLDATADASRNASDDDLLRESNGARLLEDFPDAPWVRISYVNVDTLTLDVTDYVPGADEAMDDLVRTLVHLADEYPLYDSEDFSRREMEAMDEAFRDETRWIASRDFEDDDADVTEIQAQLYMYLTSERDVYCADDLYRLDLSDEYAAARDRYYSARANDALNAPIAGQGALNI